MTSRISTPKLISKNILTNKIKCLQLLRCSTEAECKILSSVENTFAGQIIDLSNTNLSNNDLRTLAMLLIRSPVKEWEMLDLSQCNINDSGWNVLCNVFHSHKMSIKIKKIDISYNKIQWESLIILCKLLKSWQTEELLTSIDALYDSTTVVNINRFSYLFYKNIPLNVTGRLFSALLLCTYMAEQQRMIVILSASYDCIRCFQVVNCKLTDTTIKKLKHLIANYMYLVKEIAFSYNIGYSEVNIKSTILSHYVQKVTLRGSNMHSKGAYLMSIPAIIQCNDKPYKIVADYLAAVLCHNIKTGSSYLKTLPASLAVEISNNLQKTSNIPIFDSVNMNVGKEAAIDIAPVLLHNTNLQELYLNYNDLKSTGTFRILRALQNTDKLTWLNLSNNNISKHAADEIAAVLSHSTKLQLLELGNNNLQSAGVIKIAHALRNTVTLTSFGLSNNNIKEDAADDIAAVLSHNTKIEKLNLGKNKLQSAGIIKIAKALQNNKSLILFNLLDNNIREDAADEIAAVLSHSTKLQLLELGNNNLQSAGAIKIAHALRNTVTLTSFDLTNNNIREDAADDICNCFIS